jgi:hypothetical protein
MGSCYAPAIAIRRNNRLLTGSLRVSELGAAA